MKSKNILNFAIGPVMMDDEILNIGSQQIPYFRTKEFSEIMLENEKILINATNAPSNSRALFLTTSGSGAMEAAIMNIFTEEDKLLVVNGGSFGARFTRICKIHGIKFTEIKLEYFQPLTKENLEPYENYGYTGMLINIHETSTGVLYDIDLVKKFCKKNDIILIVDAISSFLADPFDMEKSGVNATILSSQKAIALPPGMSYIIVDSKSQERILNNNVKSLYFDLKDYLKDGKRGQTPFTPAVSNLIQLNKRLKLISNKGINKVINDVKIIADSFREGIKNMPFEVPVNNLSNAVTPLIPRGNMSAFEIFEHLKDNYGIFVVPSGGNLSNVLFRVGHIGAITLEDNKRLLDLFVKLYKESIL